MKRYLLLILTLVFVVSTQLWADDTDIYQTSSISLEPNVLIIFDTSISMSTADVPGAYYNPSTTYTGTKTKDAVYRKTYSHGHYSWSLVMSDYHDLDCPASVTDLETLGLTTHNVRYSGGSYVCTGTSDTLYLGNWINYDASAGGLQTRMAVAKSVIKNVIDNTDGVRFGLMRFNYEHGGYIVSPCGTDKATLKNEIDNFTASDFTPLAETLAEAGLYFAGGQSWFNDKNTGKYASNCRDNGIDCKQYLTPITERCQKNYVIIMTDGEPTQDRDPKLSSPSYINGDTIGDYDNDGNDPGPDDAFWHPSDYLDDVAKYLYENDLLPSLGTPGESFEKQNVVVYTIGFQTEQELLSETAQNGGGEYYTANSISGLSAAFTEILTNIADVNAVFVSPVVPVSRMNRTFAGNSLYVGFFKPQTSGKWAGNIKKYGLDTHGRIVDADGVEATLANGAIKDNARSFWSTSADGPDVLSGGVGGLLLNQATRNLYTNLTPTSITVFSTTNPLILPTELGLDSSDTAGKNSVINYISGSGRDWVMGDILHSKPSVVHYDINGNGQLDAGDDAFIFAGSNDGMMHCFKDSDGSEVWGFIPGDQLTLLKEYADENQTEHKYFVDGEPVVYQGTTQKILFFGERRGGNTYYALDVTNYNAPTLAYTKESTFLAGEDGNGDFILDGNGGNATLGQSWSAPTIHTIKTSSGSDTETVFLMAGGYDENQDKPLPADPLNIQPNERQEYDQTGRAVFTIEVSSGDISKFNVNAGYYADMTHSIVDVAGFDSNGNGNTNRVYAGDLGGNIFAFEDDNGDGDWSYRKLFSAPVEASTARRKIFYAPDAVEEEFGEMIFFGTGDRADPEGTSVVNRIYAVKNYWETPPVTTLTESDLTDVTEDLLVKGTEEQQVDTREALALSKGWYIKLDQNAGEKVTSYVMVFNGVAYFTTYTPESGPPPADLCEAVSGRGTARIYALNYKTGEAAFEWSDIGETDADGNTVNRGRWDRSKVIGTSIASAPVVAILEGGPQIYIGVEGGIQNIDPDVKQTLNTFYWRQMNN